MQSASSQLADATRMQPHWERMLGAGMAVVFGLLVLRNMGLFPAVFADELIYSSLSRLGKLADASIPSYLYLALFRSTNVCGSAFLECARVLNATLFVAAAPLIYAIARQVAGKGLAVAVALMSLLLPVNSYTAYFMPEALYYLMFFVLSWAALTRMAWHWASYALLTGSLLGVMTLIKVHALFLIPALSLFALLVAIIKQPNGRGLATGLAAAVLSALAALGVKFGIGTLVAGDSAHGLLGNFYGSLATGTARAPLSSLVAPALLNARAHLMGLALLFALPIAITIHTLFNAKARRGVGTEYLATLVYGLLMLGAALTMTVLYTASIADIAPREAERLHMRYYDFAFPLMLLAVAGALGRQPRQPQRAWLIALVLGVCAAFALRDLPTYPLSMVDGPDIAALHLIGKLNLVFGAAQLTILVLWAMGKGRVLAWYLFAFVPVMLMAQNGAVVAFLAKTTHPNPFDKAGMAARSHLVPAERKDLVIAGHTEAQLMRAKFQLDESAVELIDLPERAPFDLSQLPVRKKWLMLVGPHTLPDQLMPVVRTKDYALVRIPALPAARGTAP